MEDKVITAWDEALDDEIVIKYSTKTGGKRKIKTIRGWEWYFIMSSEDIAKVPDTLFNKYAGMVTKIVDKEKFSYVYVDKGKKIPVNNTFSLTHKHLISDIQKLGLKTLESDLQMYRHWLHHNKVQIETDLDILFFDIETDDTIGNIEIGRDRILSIAACDPEGNEYFISHENEEQILRDFLNLLMDYDVFTGWNSAKFDLPYIKERMKVYNLEYDWRKKVHLDLMLRLIKLFASISGLLGLSGFSLNEVSKTFLHEEKIGHEGEKIIDMYRNDFEKFKKYNIQDVRLLRKLNDKINILPLMIKECEWTGTFLNQFYIGELLDNYIIREAHRLDIHLPSKPSYQQKLMLDDVVVRGAYVMKPEPAAYDNVRVFDFKSLYPSIIMSWNIGQDSLNQELSNEGSASFIKFLNGRAIEDVEYEEYQEFLAKEKKRLDPNDFHIQTGNNSFFSRKNKSFISELINNLLVQRKEFKDKLDELDIDSDDYRTVRAEQEVVKEMANSMFGITADKSARYFNLNVCEAITLTGQFLNRSVVWLAEKHGIKTIYGDTDSIFVIIDDDKKAIEFENIINKDIKKFLKSFAGIDENNVYLEFEKTYERLLMIGKKKYTGHMTWIDGKPTSKIFSRGTENVKKDTVGYTRQYIVELTEMLVRDKVPLEEVVKWVEERYNEIKVIDLPITDLTVTTRVSKPTKQYKTETLQVRIAKDLIKRGLMLEPNVGKTNATRISYIITDAKEEYEVELEDGTKATKYRIGGVHVDDFDGKWDREYYWDVKIYAPFKRLLEVAFKDEDWDRFMYSEQEKRARVAEREEKKRIREEEKEQKRIEREEKKKLREAEKERKAIEREEKRKLREEAKIEREKMKKEKTRLSEVTKKKNESK
jgi:DNA polymerase elongation subunit (family B)